MVFQEASFPTRQAKAAKDWSPIDRMLANKRGQTKARRELPPLEHHVPPPVSTATSSTQTASWASVCAEIVAPEKSRALALEKDAGEREADDQRREAELQANLRESERRRGELEVELEAARQAAAEAAAAREEERCRWQRDQREWQEERTILKEDAARCSDLRRELEKRNADIADLRKAYNKLEEESTALGLERDQLMQRLEVEQVEMMKRVDELEKRGSSKR